MAQNDFATQLEHALRRVRSTGDLDLEGSAARPPRQRSTVQFSLDPTTHNLRVVQLDAAEGTQRSLSPPLAGHPRDSLGLPPLTFEPPPVPPQSPRRRPERPIPPGFRGKFLVFFGLAGPNAKARSQLLNVIWKLGFGFVQFVIIITLLVIASKRESPTERGVTEWRACSKPLGVWNSLWLVRLALACGTGYWDWRRNVALRQLDRTGSASGDIEAGRSSGRDASRRESNARQSLDASRRGSTDGQGGDAQAENSLPRSHLFRRLNLITNTFSIVWFVTAHVLEYSSVDSCRHTSPHLWWLTFGILCILYFMLLEIFLIGLIIFILGPILYLIYNIVLLCLGRHPLQHPGAVNADVKKIPKTLVDQIPLVLYIPPPPEEGEGPKDASSPITVPSPAHLYPPKPSPPATERKRRFRFAFLRRSKKSGSTAGGKSKKGDADGDAQTWEDNWVPGDYPFVRLEGHRAACAICLMDFDEPERKNKPKESTPKESTPGAQSPTENQPSASLSSPSSAQEIQVDELTPNDADRLQLEDAGEGPQPLRLLACGHVFHKTCVDPWLTDVSGRCPVCQRPVEAPDNTTKKKRRRTGRRTSASDNSP